MGYDAPRGLRTAHPRPYMSSFTSYRFHATTRSWLDTMIWSSAQLHSVANMVNGCFGDRKDELVAVWARDTLGLEQKDYSASSFLSHKQAVLLIYISYRSKNQNDKDLAKPWAALSLRPSGNDSTASPSRPPTPTPTSSQAHSAHTTLLLDDSPLKDHLQPWNHLCIRKYDASLRSADLALYEHKHARRRVQEESVPPEHEREGE
jgi:hypothetical protein